MSFIICILTCLIFIFIILIKPSIKVREKSFDIYWIVPLVGGIILLLCRHVTKQNLIDGFLSNSSSNPIKVLLLFFVMSLISIYLDETGFFEYLAMVTVKKAKSSQLRLFVIFYFMVSALTVFTSNDIVILTFTPFICKFCKSANISATPYIVAEFAGANTWSMIFVIGNPTNIYLCSATNIEFLEYFSVMALPTITAGISSFLLLLFIFRKSLQSPINVKSESYELKDKNLAIIGLVHLALCTLTLALSSYINIEMWIVSLIFALSLFIIVLIYRISKRQKPKILWYSIKRLPFCLVPTIIGMFVVVLGFVNNGTTSAIANFFGSNLVTLKYGVASTIFANFMNNIPMSVFFSKVHTLISGEILKKAVYSTVIGSNLGALLSPMGALAGIMFTSILNRHSEKFTFIVFMKYGSVVTMVSLASALISLEILL